MFIYIKNYLIKNKLVLLLGLSFFLILYIVSQYKKKTREQDEVTTYAKIYLIKSAAKGYIYVHYYFITTNKDTIRDSGHIYPTMPKEYYYSNKFLVKYYRKNPSNNKLEINTPLK